MHKSVLYKVRTLPVWTIPAFLYAVGVSARIIAAFSQSQNPSIMPDESLYFNLARSLYTSGEVALRGQPLTYDSLLYSLVISPMMALPQSVDLYRAIQVLGAFMMNAAVFPAWALAYRMTQNKLSALFVAVIALVMPDAALSQIIMTESLGYPLLLTTLWLAHGAFTERDTRRTIAGTVCAFLLYLNKPGAIAVLIAFLICLFIRYLLKKDPQSLNQLLSSLTTAVALALVSQLILRYSLSIDYQYTSLYQSQTQAFSIEHLLKSANGLFLYLLFFSLACLALPLAIPLAHEKSFDAPERHFFWMVLLSALFTVLGIVYIIYIDEYTGDPFYARVHLRYLAGFIPALFAISLSPKLNEKKMNGRLLATLAFMAAGTTVFGFSAIGSGRSYPVDALALASALGAYDFTDAKKLLTFLTLFGLMMAAYALVRHGWSKRVKMCVMAVFIIFCVLNNASGYVQMRHNNDALWAQDAIEVTNAIPGQEMVCVAADGAFFHNPSTALDVRSRTPLAVVELDDILENTARGGAYAPFVPKSYWMTHAERETPDAKWLVMDRELLKSIVPANGEMVSATANGLYAIMPIGEGQPWVHSALSGFNRGWVQAGSRLSVFNEALCAKETLHVWFLARAGAGVATLTLTGNDFSCEFALSDTLTWIETDVPATTDGEPFRLFLSSDTNVLVETYLVQ